MRLTKVSVSMEEGQCECYRGTRVPFVAKIGGAQETLRRWCTSDSVLTLRALEPTTTDEDPGKTRVREICDLRKRSNIPPLTRALPLRRSSTAASSHEYIYGSAPRGRQCLTVLQSELKRAIFLPTLCHEQLGHILSQAESRAVYRSG